MNPELARRIAFTLGALLVYRIGTHVPLPGINPLVLAYVFPPQQDGFLAMVNAASGGAFARLAVFALGITPYVTAALILQLTGFVVPRLRALRHAGARGRRTVERYTWFLTLFMAVFQSYGMARALEGIGSLVIEPGWPFRLSAVFTLTGGTVFLAWLAGQITARGIGNGIALILCAGILAELPRSIVGVVELGRQGLLPEHLLAGVALLAVALVIVMVAVEKARRLEPVAFPGRAPAHLSFKLNGAGVIPGVIASFVLALPPALIGLFAPDGAAFGRAGFSPGAPLYLLSYALVIFLCVYLYTAFVLDPAEAAETLQRYGGTIPLVAPGEATADHLDSVLSRVTLIGAAYFVTVCLMPELLISWAQVPFYLGGASLLVLVCTVLDLEAEVRSIGQMELGG